MADEGERGEVVAAADLGRKPEQTHEMRRHEEGRGRSESLDGGEEGLRVGEPDRWRNTTDLPIKHFNGVDHYLDAEELAQCTRALASALEAMDRPAVAGGI